MPRCYVSIGSNIDREMHIAAAVHALGQAYAPLTVSSVYESKPVGFRGANFYNLAVGFDTRENLRDLVARLACIEAACGRDRSREAFESRTLDLDLLLYGELCTHEGDIDLPRRDIEHYAFVLAPLAEIAPDLRHPRTGATVGEMWRNFANRDQALWPAPFGLRVQHTT